MAATLEPRKTALLESPMADRRRHRSRGLMVESEASSSAKDHFGGVCSAMSRERRDQPIHDLVRDAGSRMGMDGRREDEACIASRRAGRAAMRGLISPIEAGPQRRRAAPLQKPRSAAAEIATSTRQLENVLVDIEATIVRSQILSGERACGPRTRTVRSIESQRRAAAREQGWACSRGETQALVAATLGTERDSRHRALAGESRASCSTTNAAVRERETAASARRSGRDRPRQPRHRALSPGMRSRRLPYSMRVVRDHRVERPSPDGLVCGGCLAYDAGGR